MKVKVGRFMYRFTGIEKIGVCIIVMGIFVFILPLFIKILPTKEEKKLISTVKDIIEVGENEYNNISTVNFDELEYDGEKVEDGKISFNDEGNASVVVYKNNVCVYKTDQENDVILDRKLTKEECLSKVIEVTDESCFSTSVIKDEIMITGYKEGCPKDIVIPSIINNKSVTIIGTGAFSNSNIESIVFPHTLKKINSNIVNWSLSFKMPILDLSNTNIEYIEDYGFFIDDYYYYVKGNSAINEVILPNSIKEVGHMAFGFSNYCNPEGDITILKGDNEIPELGEVIEKTDEYIKYHMKWNNENC